MQIAQLYNIQRVDFLEQTAYNHNRAQFFGHNYNRKNKICNKFVTVEFKRSLVCLQRLKGV